MKSGAREVKHLQCGIDNTRIQYSTETGVIFKAVELDEDLIWPQVEVSLICRPDAGYPFYAIYEQYNVHAMRSILAWISCSQVVRRDW